MRRFVTIFATLITGFALALPGFGQQGGKAVGASSPSTLNTEQEAAPVPTLRNCGTEQKVRESLEAHPELVQEHEAHKKYVEELIRENGGNKTNGVITIPTVIHVVYRTSAQNLSAARIQEQIDILNEDYRRLNPDASQTHADFVSVAGDCSIEFCLATRDPSGNTTDGITRTQTTTSNIGSTNQYYVQAPIWDRTKYMNIWVCELGGGLLGFAYKPGTAGASYDGIVIGYQYFGETGASSPYNKGRTTTHEVGHWLGLDHIWGDGGCGVDDGIADTPESDAANYSCNLNTTSCGSRDMVQNYMDYTNDGCMNIFTNGQCAVMNSTLSGSRGTLVFSNGCSGGTPPPTACDTTSLNNPLQGTATLYASGGTGAWGYVAGHNNYGDISKANYYSNSSGYTSCENVRVWFGAAAAASSASKVTVFVWDEVGGEPGTVLAQQDVLIDDIVAAGGDITATFSTPATLSGAFFAGVKYTYTAGDTVGLITNADGDVTTGTAWEQWNDNSWHAYNSTSSWQLELDHAIFPLVGGGALTVAISPASPTIVAGGNVALTASGGSTYSWSPATGLSSTTGATVTASPSVTTTYTVTATDAGGNCTGQETVTVTVTPVSVEESLLGNTSLQVYPNPNSGTFQLEFNQLDRKNMTIEVTNMIGQVIYKENLSSFSGDYKNTINLNSAGKGIYILRITDGANGIARKVVVE